MRFKGRFNSRFKTGWSYDNLSLKTKRAPRRTPVEPIRSLEAGKLPGSARIGLSGQF